MATVTLLAALTCLVLAVDAVPYPWPTLCSKKCPPNYYCKISFRQCRPPPCGGQRHKRGAVSFPCPRVPYNYCPPVAVCLPIKKPTTTTTTTTTVRPPVETCRTKICPRGQICQMRYPLCPRQPCERNFLRGEELGFPCPPIKYCPPAAVCVPIKRTTTTTTRRPPPETCRTKKCPRGKSCRMLYPSCPRPVCLDQFPLRRGEPDLPCPPINYCPPTAVCVSTPTTTTTTTRRPPVTGCTNGDMPDEPGCGFGLQ